MSNNQFDKLVEKLDILIKLEALNAVRGKTTTESVLILSEIGFGTSEIAKILGTTPNYVSKVKSENKKVKTAKPAEIEFHPEDLLNVLNNSTLFPSTFDLRNFATEIINPSFQEAFYESRDEVVKKIIQSFQESDRRKQALFIQALEHRASARQLKDTQFLRFLEGWESNIKG